MLHRKTSLRSHSGIRSPQDAPFVDAEFDWPRAENNVLRTSCLFYTRPLMPLKTSKEKDSRRAYLTAFRRVLSFRLRGEFFLGKLD